MLKKLILIRGYLRLKKQSYVPIEQFEDTNGNYCAIGAIRYPKRKLLPKRARDAAELELHRRARADFNKTTAFQVNDELGLTAVINLYKQTIFHG